MRGIEASCEPYRSIFDERSTQRRKKSRQMLHRRLVAHIERVATRIAASPHIGGTTRKSGFLRFPVGKYLIVYEIANDEVVVLYVRHSARPRPWEGE
jgi:plasmid stabilization system protein ParE